MAVDRGTRGDDDFRQVARPCRSLQKTFRSDHVDPCHGDRFTEHPEHPYHSRHVIDPVRNGCFAFQIGPFKDVRLDETKAGRIATLQQFPFTGAQIIDNGNRVTLLQVMAGKMGADESGAPGDEDPGR